MTVASDPGSTSISLLQRVRRRDAQAWERLCGLYGPLIYAWCRRSGLQHSDAADAAQEVFQAVFRDIADYRGRATPDGERGSFRGWLWSVTRTQVRLHFRRQERTPQPLGGSEARELLGEQPAGSGASENDASEPHAAEARRWVVQRALELIQRDFHPTTWQAFTRVALKGQSSTEVAAELGMSVNAVRQAKFRVLKRLRCELDGQL